eukprot:9476923-Pyramimonas_sp.AAC.1
MDRKGGVRRRFEQLAEDARADDHEPELSESKIRGGVRQRSSRSAVSNEPSPEAGPFSRTMRKDWATGTLSSAKVQEYAFAAQQQGAEGLDNLAAVGTYGKWPQNLLRDLKNLFGYPLGSPPIDWVEVPMKHGRKIAHPVIFPHKFFMEMCARRRDVWDQRIVGLDGGLVAFWESMAHSRFV